jgi:hypothetical protein
LQILQGINRKYTNLFGGGGSGGNEEGIGFYEKWGWIATINSLSNNDRTKWEYFFEMNVIEFLNTVAFYKDMNEQSKSSSSNWE